MSNLKDLLLTEQLRTKVYLCQRAVVGLSIAVIHSENKNVDE